MCEEYKKFWQGRYLYKRCDFCGKQKESRGLGYEEVDVLSQCWDCYIDKFPVSLQAILDREVQEYLKEKKGKEEAEAQDTCGRNTMPCAVPSKVEVVDTRTFVSFCEDRCDDCPVCEAAWKEAEDLENLRDTLHLDWHNSQNRGWYPKALSSYFDDIFYIDDEDDHDGRHGASCYLCCP